MTNIEKIDELLKKYNELDIDIKGIELQMKIEGVKGVCYDDMPKASNSKHSSVECELNRIEKLKNEKLHLEIKKEGIDNMLRILSDDELKLIKLRYFKGLEYRDIAFQLNMNDNYLVNKRTRILNKLIPFALKHKLIV